MKKRVSKKLIVILMILVCIVGASVMAYAYSQDPNLCYDYNSGYFFLCFEKEEVQEWVKINCKVANGYDTNVNHKKKIEMTIDGYYKKYEDARKGTNQIQNIYNVQLVDENGNKGTTAQYWIEPDILGTNIEQAGVIYARLPIIIRTNLEKGYYWNANVMSEDTSQDMDNSNLNEQQLDQSTFSFSIDTNNVGMTNWGNSNGYHNCRIYLNQEEYPVYKVNLDPNGGTIKYASTTGSQISKDDNYLVECKSHQWGYVLDEKFWGDEYKAFWTKVHALSDKKVFYCDDTVKYPKLDITAEKSNNIFLGYYYNDVQIIDENGQLQVDYDYFDKDVTITAKWQPLYKITFDTDGGTLNYSGRINKPAYGQVTNNTVGGANYILQEKGTQWAVPTTSANENLSSTYIKYYDLYGNTPFLNMNVPVPTIKVKADKEGFVFNGFKNAQGKLIIDAEGNWSSEVDYNYFTSNTTLYAQWAPANNVQYVVNHWKQKLYYNGTKDYTNADIHNDVNYSLADTQTFTDGVTGSKVTPELNNYTGFTAPSSIEATIKSDGTTVIDYYYTRNSYTLTVKPNGSTWNGSTENRFYTLRYEEEMNIPNPSRTGYIFKKWIMTPTDKGSSLVDKDTTSKTFTMGYEDTVLTVTMGKGDNDESWEPIKYTVTYDRNTPAGSLSAKGGETPDSYHVYDVTSKLSENGFILEGYTFVGWKSDSKIYGDSSNKGAVNVINLTNINNSTITMYAQWTPANNIKYVVNHWKQKLYYDDTTDYTDAAIHDEVNYSLSNTETFTDGVADELVTPEVKHYTGFTSPLKITVKINGDGSTVVNYYYTRNEYNVGEDDGNGGLHLICGTGIASTSGAGRYKYGETVYIDAEVSSGYTWLKWTGTMEALKKDYMFYMPAYDVTLTANATPKKYLLYFDGNKLEYSTVDELTLETTEKEVTFMEVLGELPIPSLVGARFDGWYTKPSGGEEWTQDTLYSVSGKKILYAHWTDITEPEGDIEDSYVCPFDGTNISFNCKDTGGSGLKAINLYKGTEANPENIVAGDTLSVDIVNEEGNCYGILASSFKANPDGDNYYILEIIDNAGNTTTKVFELICNEPLTWSAKLWRLNKSYAMAGTSDSLVYWTDGSGVYGDMTGFIQTDIEGHVDRIEYDFVDERIPDIVTEIENAHENDTYTDNVQFTIPKDPPGYASYVKVKLYRNVGTSHETVDVKTINFRIDKYDFSRIRTRIRVTSGMYIPENEKGHVPVY